MVMLKGKDPSDTENESYMTIRKGNSKGKLASRTIPTSDQIPLLHLTSKSL
jgi:hypothetical protein